MLVVHNPQLEILRGNVIGFLKKQDLDLSMEYCISTLDLSMEQF